MRPALVMLLCCCGTPEDLLQFTSTVRSFDGATFELQLLTDLGATAEGCSTFTQSRTLAVRDQQPFTVPVLRAETIGPNGTPRCFRLRFDDETGARESLTWAPMDHDLHLPELKLTTQLTLLSASPDDRFLGYRALDPRAFADTALDLDVQPPRHFVEVLDGDGGVLWRATEGDPATTVLSVGATELSVILADELAEDQRCQVQAGAFVLGRQFSFDPLGRGVELLFEYRALAPVTPCPVVLGRRAPLSRGAACNGGEPCPFTDGRFAPVRVPRGLTTLTVDLGSERAFDVVTVRGLWAAAPFEALRFELGGDGGTSSFELLHPAAASVSIAKDGLNGAGREDVALHPGMRTARTVSLTALDDAGTSVQLDRLAELSVWTSIEPVDAGSDGGM